jgi:ammonia channel protein AmtB
MHPLGALITGGVAGAIFVWMFTWTQNKWKVDDVLGVWPLHGLCGAWGGIAAGIFGQKMLGGWAASVYYRKSLYRARHCDCVFRWLCDLWFAEKNYGHTSGS